MTQISKRAVHRPREVRMGEILAAARSVFSDKGYESASMSEIASLVGVSEAAIYKYYESKRHLLLSVIRDWYHAMIAESSIKVAGIVGVRSRVRVLIWQHLKTIRGASDLCRLFYAEVRSRPDYVGSELHALNRRATGLLTQELERGVEEGLIRKEMSIRLIRDVVYGGIEHHVAAFLAGRGSLDCDGIATAVTQLIFEGMQAEPAPRAPAGDMVDRLEKIADRMERALKARAA